MAIGSRASNAFTDLLLGLELWLFFFIWLREGRQALRGAPEKRRLFLGHGVMLFGAAAWCTLAVYIHLHEPLPQVGTPAFKMFLLLGGVAPALFPYALANAFLVSSPVCCTASGRRRTDLAAAALWLAQIACVLTGVDFARGQPVAPIWITPMHTLDGRSYAGLPHGIKFDLISSMPCWRGDSFFFLAACFCASNLFGVLLCMSVGWGKEAIDCPERRTLAKRMVAGLAVMLLNSQALPVLVTVYDVKMQDAIDVFHFGQGVSMFMCFFTLRSVLRLDGGASKRSN